MLRGRYGPTVVLALVALCPDLIVSSGASPLTPVLTHDLHASQFSIELGSSLSDAGYALGAVVAIDLIQRYPQRRLFVATQAAFGLGALLSAVATGGWLYGSGRVVDGMATGLLLVLALPPLVTTFGAARLPGTAALVNVGLFGAAAAGPLVAAGVAATGAWRLLYGALVVTGAAGAALAWRTLPGQGGLDPEQPLNASLFPLAVAATVLPFFGAAELTTHPFRSAVVWAPLAAGVVSLAGLVVTQYRRQRALIPVERLNSTLPLAGTACAMVGGAAFVLCLGAIQTWVADVAHRPALNGAALLWPGALGAGVAALLFGRAMRTRLLVVVIAVGLACLTAGAALLQLLGGASGQDSLVLGVALLLGLGAGMTVAPGLFVAALSLPSALVGRAVGLVELLRAEAAFLLAPVLTHIAQWHGSRPAQVLGGLHTGAWVALGVGAAGLVGLAALLLAGWAAPQRPDLDAWLDGGDSALTSPRVAEAIRP